MRKLILLFLMLIGFTAFGQVVNSSILNNSQYISGKKQTVAPTAPPVGFIRVYNFNDSLHFKNSVRDWNLGKIIYQDSLDYYYTKTQTDSIGNKIMDTVYLYADSLGYLRDTVYLYIDSIDQLQNDSIKYVLRDGTRQLTGDWDAGAFKISNTDIIQGNVLISNNGINGYLTEFNSSKAIDTAFIYHSGNEYRINTTTDNGAFQLQVAGGGYFGGTTRISSATSPRLDFLRAATKQWQIGIPASVNRFSILEDGTDERFVIKAGGNVGIKVTDPVATLDVNGSIRSRTGIFQLNDGTTTGGGLYFYKAITGSGSSLAPTLFAETGNALYFMVNGSSATPKAMLTSGGKFNINDVSNTTYDLYVNGTAKVVTSVTTPTIKLTTGASVNYIWKCSNADGSGAWVALAASETYKGVVDGDDGKINHGATALIDGTGTSGDYYRCYDAGTYDYGNPSGNSITLEIGDEVHYDGAKWQYQEGVGYTLQAMDATTLGGAKLGGSLQINSEVLNIANADMSDITVLGTGTDVGKIWTIDNDVVTYAKMQNISAQWKILGRSSSGAGDTEELSMSGTGNVVGDISPVITDSIRVPAVAFGSAWVNSTGALDRGSAYPKFVAASDSITKHKGWYYSLRDSVITSMGDIINIGDSITKHTGWHYSLRDSVSNSMDSITMHTTNYYSLRDSVRSILDIRLPAIENDTTNWNIAWDSVAVFDTRLDALELTNTGTNTGDVTLFGNSGLAFHSGQTGLHMGTPSSITASSTNSVTDTTHTHAITGVPSPFYVGATSMTSTGVQLNYLKDATGTTGTTSTNLVFSTSPTLVTPTLGVATATSINKVAITAPATSATLTIANGKTLTASNTLTLAGTDATVMTFPTTSATIARTDAGQTFTGVNTMSDSLLVPIRAYNSTTFNNSKRTVSEDSFRDKIETITAGGLLPAGTEGQTLYNNAGTWTASSSRFWDDVNGYYGINTATPERTLAIHGVGSGDSKIGLYVNKTGTDQLIFSLGNTGSGQNDGLLSIWDNGTKKVNIAANNSRGGD
ncbi:MAG: hypothetical protein M0Q91_18135, partial [Methanoregula sp.]|nr:hypothetical protein [Methanoregula sp.]